MFEGNHSYSIIRRTLIKITGLVRRIFLVHETETTVLSIHHEIVSASMNSLIRINVTSVCKYIERNYAIFTTVVQKDPYDFVPKPL